MNNNNYLIGGILDNDFNSKVYDMHINHLIFDNNKGYEVLYYIIQLKKRVLKMRQILNLK